MMRYLTNNKFKDDTNNPHTNQKTFAKLDKSISKLITKKQIIFMTIKTYAKKKSY